MKMDATTISTAIISGIGAMSFCGVLGGIILRDTFKTKKSCEKDVKNCQTRVCMKIDDLKADMQKQISIIDTKREGAREESTRFMNDMYAHMGKVEQYMKDHDH